MRKNIKEVTLVDLGENGVRPGDTGFLRDVAGLHDYLGDQLSQLSKEINDALLEARITYYQQPGVKASREEQAYTSMLTGHCCVIFA